VQTMIEYMSRKPITHDVMKNVRNTGLVQLSYANT